MAYQALKYQDRIVTDPQILVGKPTIKGTRIFVARVLEYLAVNPSSPKEKESQHHFDEACCESATRLCMAGS